MSEWMERAKTSGLRQSTSQSVEFCCWKEYSSVFLVVQSLVIGVDRYPGTHGLIKSQKRLILSSHAVPVALKLPIGPGCKRVDLWGLIVELPFHLNLASAIHAKHALLAHMSVVALAR